MLEDGALSTEMGDGAEFSVRDAGPYAGQQSLSLLKETCVVYANRAAQRCNGAVQRMGTDYSIIVDAAASHS